MEHKRFFQEIVLKQMEVDDEVLVLAKKGGEGLGYFREVLDESSIEADMPE